MGFLSVTNGKSPRGMAAIAALGQDFAALGNGDRSELAVFHCRM
jgi:hypothetical protein